MSPLVIHKILRLFVNTLTVNDTHYLVKRENLTQPIQIQLSKKQKTFAEILSAFPNYLLNFKHSTKKYTLVADIFAETPFGKNMVR